MISFITLNDHVNETTYVLYVCILESGINKQITGRLPSSK